MKKRNLPLIAAGCVLVLAGLAGYCLPEPVEVPPRRILMENQGGRVVFTHKLHSTPGGNRGDIACAACHHELRVAPAGVTASASPRVMECSACHGAADAPGFRESHQARWRAEQGDASCLSCHHMKIAGLSDKWNHRDHWDYAGDDCTACHHTAGRTASSIKPQRCANCHTAGPGRMTARTRKDAAHEACRSCHDELFAAGAKGCAACHSGTDLAAEAARGAMDKGLFSCAACHNPIAGSMDAFHGTCIGCHEELGKGPDREAGSCPKCHAR